MNFNKDFARELCRDLGIEWDTSLPSPAIQGTLISADDIKDLFPSITPTHFSMDLTITTGMHDYNDYNDVDPKCA